MSNAVKFLFEEKRYDVGRFEGEIGDPLIRQSLLESRVIDIADGIVTPRFVGVISGGENAICILPKFEFVPTQSLVKTLVHTLRRYGHSQAEDYKLLPDGPNPPKVSRIALANWLIKDYTNYGLFKRNRHVLRINRHGPTAWPSTIERNIAYPTAAGPVYLETLTHAKVRDTSHLVSCLHKFALKHCFTELSALLGYKEIQVSHELAEDLPVIPSDITIDRVISSELRSTHKIRDRELLRTLRNWFRIQDKVIDNKLELYGTLSFDRVWEQICKFIFGDVSQSWIGDMPRPIWRSSTGVSHNGDSLRPDIVRLISSSKDLLILDAKYYAADLESMEHLPGVPDVSKQLNYEAVIKSHPKFDPTYSITNIFLFPASSGPTLSIRGAVDIAGLEGGPVKVVFMNAWKVMEMYIRREVLSEGSLTTLVD